MKKTHATVPPVHVQEAPCRSRVFGREAAASFHRPFFTYALGIALLIASSLVSARAQNTSSESATARDALRTSVGAALPVRGETAAMASSSYLIAPNDVLAMKVYGEDDLDAKVKVNRDGTVTLPLLGSMALGGKSLGEATALVTEQLDRRFLVNPRVSLSVVEYSKRKFTVLGEVQRPGVYEYSGEETLTLLGAIAQAGGYTRAAAPNKTTVQRTEHGKVQTHRVNPEAAAKEADARLFEVRPDDTITVGAKLF